MLRKLSRFVRAAREQQMTHITLGPFNEAEATFATWFVHFLLLLPESLRVVILTQMGPEFKALVYFMCADRSGGELRSRQQIRGLRVLGFPVIHQVGCAWRFCIDSCLVQPSFGAVVMPTFISPQTINMVKLSSHCGLAAAVPCCRSYLNI